jgi:hypothetical protein
VWPDPEQGNLDGDPAQVGGGSVCIAIRFPLDFARAEAWSTPDRSKEVRNGLLRRKIFAQALIEGGCRRTRASSHVVRWAMRVRAECADTLEGSSGRSDRAKAIRR